MVGHLTRDAKKIELKEEAEVPKVKSAKKTLFKKRK